MDEAKAKKGWDKQASHSEFWAVCDRKCAQLDLDPGKASSFFEVRISIHAIVVSFVFHSKYNEVLFIGYIMHYSATLSRVNCM